MYSGIYNIKCIALKIRLINKFYLLFIEDWVCNEGQFKCHGGPCLEHSLICNGKIDCLDTWEDEEGCPFKCSIMAETCECKDVHINCTGKGLHGIPIDTERAITW
ncbi:hypothetical protein AAG570_013639 [Ranatra chinensis]|uniref:Uncharacterized protein n=1 Tax=Ranatra chinensis TaxID=642074 RepID=A0ABD0YCS0_9HEMI